MPEGDAIHRAARRLQVLVGERVQVETPHPQAQVKRLPERLNGRLLEGVEAVGKNLLLHFEGGLVLRGAEREAVLWNGPVLELHGRGTRRLGPDILAVPPDFDAMLARFRLADQGRAVGEALLDQRLVAGIGNLWKAEALWAARVSPWRRLVDVSDAELLDVLHEAERQMRSSLEHGKGRGRGAYRRVGRP